MAETFQILLQISLVLFMVGNLLAMGLGLNLADALAGMRNTRFVVLSVLWGFLLCPALAVFLTMVLPLSPPYAVGLILIGLAPCAPFLPRMVARARGDLGYAAAFMLLASVLIVVAMPVAVPLLVEDLSTSALAIAKPLLLFLLLPLSFGLAIQSVSRRFASLLSPLVTKVTGLATVAMLILCLGLYGGGFFSVAGTFAIAAQLIFFAVATSASYFLSGILPERERSVLALGMSTRNLAAAFAVLFAIPGLDNNAIAMVAFGVPVQLIVALLSARWLGVRAAVGEPVMSPSFKRP